MNTEKPAQPVAEKKLEKIVVISDANVDFPSLGWGINIGDERELPADEHAREAILSNHHIKIKK